MKFLTDPQTTQYPLTDDQNTSDLHTTLHTENFTTAPGFSNITSTVTVSTNINNFTNGFSSLTTTPSITTMYHDSFLSSDTKSYGKVFTTSDEYDETTTTELSTILTTNEIFTLSPRTDFVTLVPNSLNMSTLTTSSFGENLKTNVETTTLTPKVISDTVNLIDKSKQKNNTTELQKLNHNKNISDNGSPNITSNPIQLEKDNSTVELETTSYKNTSITEYTTLQNEYLIKNILSETTTLPSNETTVTLFESTDYNDDDDYLENNPTTPNSPEDLLVSSEFRTNIPKLEISTVKPDILSTDINKNEDFPQRQTVNILNTSNYENSPEKKTTEIYTISNTLPTTDNSNSIQSTTVKYTYIKEFTTLTSFENSKDKDITTTTLKYDSTTINNLNSGLTFSNYSDENKTTPESLSDDSYTKNYDNFSDITYPKDMNTTYSPTNNQSQNSIFITTTEINNESRTIPINAINNETDLSVVLEKPTIIENNINLENDTLTKDPFNDDTTTSFILNNTLNSTQSPTLHKHISHTTMLSITNLHTELPPIRINETALTQTTNTSINNECAANADCSSTEACFSGICKNPCLEKMEPCASNAICLVFNHSLICKCPHGLIGNASEECIRGILFNCN